MQDAPTGEREPTIASSPSGIGAGTSYLVVGRLAMAVLGWGGTVLIARRLDQEAFGQFTLVFSLLGMLSIVTDLGVGRIVIGALMRDDEQRATVAGSYILLRTTLGVAGYLAAMGVVLLAGYPREVVVATAVAGLVVVLATPSDAYDIAFQVRQKLGSLAVIGTVGQLAQIALTVALVIHGGSLVWFTVPAVLNEAIILAWEAPAAHKLLEFRYRFDAALWWSLLKEAVPLSAGAAFATLYYRVDSIMLASLDSFESVGVYGVAYKFVDLVHFVPASLTIAILAPLTAAWPDDRASFVSHVTEGLTLLSIVAGGAMIGFWAFAGPVVRLLYGADYAAAETATRIVVTGESLAFASSLFIIMLIAVGHQRAYPLITLSGLAINIALNLVLIPRYSFEGAAAATLATEAVVLALLFWRVRAVGGILPTSLGPLLRLPVAMALGLGVGLGLDAVGPWMAAGLAMVVTYLGSVHLLGIAGPGGFAGLLGRGGDE